MSLKFGRASFKLGNGSRFSIGPRSASLKMGGVRIGTRSSSIKIGGNTLTFSHSEDRASDSTNFISDNFTQKINISIHDDGRLTFSDLSGAVLSKTMIRKIKRDYREQINELYLKTHDKISQKTQIIIDIHKNHFYSKTNEEWTRELLPGKFVKQKFHESKYAKPHPKREQIHSEIAKLKFKKTQNWLACGACVFVISFLFMVIGNFIKFSNSLYYYLLLEGLLLDLFSSTTCWL